MDTPQILRFRRYASDGAGDLWTVVDSCRNLGAKSPQKNLDRKFSCRTSKNLCLKREDVLSPVVGRSLEMYPDLVAGGVAKGSRNN